MVSIDYIQDNVKRLQRINLSAVENINLSTELNAKGITNDIRINVLIFNNNSLSSLEAIAKYLREEKMLRFGIIAKLLCRSLNNVSDAYYSARQKMPLPYAINENIESNYYLPLDIFSDKQLSVLEAITKYLKEELNLKYCQIARMLNRDDRTIWTVYMRARKKHRALKINESISANTVQNSLSCIQYGIDHTSKIDSEHITTNTLNTIDSTTLT